jgi:hypothetical protein
MGIDVVEHALLRKKRNQRGSGLMIDCHTVQDDVWSIIRAHLECASTRRTFSERGCVIHMHGECFAGSFAHASPTQAFDHHLIGDIQQYHTRQGALILRQKRGQILGLRQGAWVTVEYQIVLWITARQKGTEHLMHDFVTDQIAVINHGFNVLTEWRIGGDFLAE